MGEDKQIELSLQQANVAIILIRTTFLINLLSSFSSPELCPLDNITFPDVV